MKSYNYFRKQNTQRTYSKGFKLDSPDSTSSDPELQLAMIPSSKIELTFRIAGIKQFIFMPPFIIHLMALDLYR